MRKEGIAFERFTRWNLSVQIEKGWDVGHIGEMKNACKILIGNTWSKDRLGLPHCRSEIGILRSLKCGRDTTVTWRLAVVYAVMSPHAV
jgi:hypothetical protein